MYSKNTLNVPEIGSTYAPYFYASGRYRWQAAPSSGSSPFPLTHTPTAYDFTSDLISSAGHKHPQTVDQVISYGYLSLPRGDPTTALVTDRRHTSWLGLDDLITQVQNRFAIYSRNMYELDQSVCEAHNSLFRQVADQGGPANQRQQYSTQKAVQKIYEQKREERLSLWQDVSRLRLALPEAAHQYLAAYRKEYLLKSLEGDSQ